MPSVFLDSIGFNAGTCSRLRKNLCGLPHHDQQAPDDQNQTEHGRMLCSNMLLLILISLIGVTFSTPTRHFADCQEE